MKQIIISVRNFDRRLVFSAEDYGELETGIIPKQIKYNKYYNYLCRAILISYIHGDIKIETYIESILYTDERYIIV